MASQDCEKPQSLVSGKCKHSAFLGAQVVTSHSLQSQDVPTWKTLSASKSRKLGHIFEVTTTESKITDLVKAAPFSFHHNFNACQAGVSAKA